MIEPKMRNKSKIKVAIAGTGFGESVHLPALRNSEVLEPVSIWHPRKSKLNETCKSHDLIGYTSWEESENTAYKLFLGAHSS